ncbi:hypothetical protein [Mycobacterium marinum]|uniref:hypothetical protein n=1 Tax=Mycobacterium marinum TaxID=1781 RepID=UPI0012DDA8C7
MTVSLFIRVAPGSRYGSCGFDEALERLAGVPGEVDPMRQATGRRGCTGNKAYRIMLSTIIFQMAVRTVKQMD